MAHDTGDVEGSATGEPLRAPASVPASGAARLRALQDLSALMASTLDRDTVVGGGLDSVMRLLGVSATSLWLLSPEGGRLDLIGGRGFTDEFYRDFDRGLPLDAPHDVVRAFVSGEPVVHADAAASDVATPVRDAYARYGIGLGSLVAVPLQTPGGRIGGLTLAWGAARTFSDEDLAFDEALAAVFAVALENARLHDAETRAQERAARELATTTLLLEAATILAEAGDLSTGLARLLGIMRAAVPGIRTVLYDAPDEMGTLTVLAAYGDPTPPVGASMPLSGMTRQARETFVTGRTVVVDFDALPPAERGMGERFGVHLLLAVPAVYDDEVMGVLVVDDPSDANRRFTALDTGIVEAFAAQVAAALRNAHLLDAERRAWNSARQELENTTLLLEAAGALAEPSTLQGLLRTLTAILLKVTGHGRASISLWDEARRTLTMATSEGDAPVTGGLVLAYDDASPLTREVVSYRRTVLADYDAMTDESSRLAVAFGSHLALIVPIVYRQRLVGLITADDPGTRREFTAREVEIAEGLAAQASVAIENARLFESTRRSAELGRVLAQAAGSLAASLELEGALPEVLAAAARALRASAATLHVRDTGGWRAAAVEGVSRELAGEFVADREAEVLNRVFETRRQVSVSVSSVVASAIADGGPPDEGRCLIAQPVLYRDRVTAVLTLYFGSSDRALGEEEQYFLSRIAFTLGVTQENAGLYRAQRNVADQLQESLLQLPRSVPGVEFAADYRAAVQEARVGGDFYDLFQMDGGRVVVVIGDVSGKGLQAASLTALAKSAFRAHVVEDHDPGTVLAKANRLVHMFTPSGTFLSAFLGVLDTTTGDFTYTNAGHPPVVRIRAAGAELLEGVNPVIGAFGAVEYTTHTTTVAPGDVLLFYTDGIIEARGPDGMFGEERLLAEAERLAGSDPAEILSGVLGATLAFAGDRLRDDVALLAVRLRSAPDLDPGERYRAQLSGT